MEWDGQTRYLLIPPFQIMDMDRSVVEEENVKLSVDAFWSWRTGSQFASQPLKRAEITPLVAYARRLDSRVPGVESIPRMNGNRSAGGFWDTFGCTIRRDDRDSARWAVKRNTHGRFQSSHNLTLKFCWCRLSFVMYNLALISDFCGCKTYFLFVHVFKFKFWLIHCYFLGAKMGWISPPLRAHFYAAGFHYWQL